MTDSEDNHGSQASEVELADESDHPVQGNPELRDFMDKIQRKCSVSSFHVCLIVMLKLILKYYRPTVMQSPKTIRRN
jgi:hypothetical protein